MNVGHAEYTECGADVQALTLVLLFAILVKQRDIQK